MNEREIFVRAMRANPADRGALLDELCGSSAAMRGRIEALLAADDQIGDFLEKPVMPRSAIPRNSTSDAASFPFNRIGQTLGPYRLLKAIGDGGMGTVYLAEQQAPFSRLVAVKIVKQGLGSKEVAARFELERQALALMDHPNIARVLDGGTTDEGRTYFVMELIDGQPITEYCNHHRLDAQQRLQLLEEVCRGVQHSHQKGIIHRDLKPSNILVTVVDDRPVPKIIDFGVAKVVAESNGETAGLGKTMETRIDQLVGTLEYMSPEQTRFTPEDIDTRSDIYSLGVIAYELLTGETPLKAVLAPRASYDEILRSIRETEPIRPSVLASARAACRSAAPTKAWATEQSKDQSTDQSTGPTTRQSIEAGESSESAQSFLRDSGFRRHLREDLDWIVVKCLEKDRGRRYATVDELGRDLRRYLSGDAVEARPPSSLYLARKFIGRHRVGIGSLCAIAVIFLAGLVAATTQALRATRAEAKLRRETTLVTEERDRAVSAESKLADARDKAVAAQAEEARQRRVAVDLGQLAKRQAYAARLNLAYLAWQSGDAARALLLLEELRPRVDEDDWRGFDWYYLWRVCHPGLIGSWQTGGGQPFGLLFIDEETPSGPDNSKLDETRRRESGAAGSDPTTASEPTNVVPSDSKPSVSVPIDVVPSVSSLGDSRPRKSGGGDSEHAGSRPSDAASRPASRVATLVTCGWTGIDIWDVADGGAASRRGSFATGNIWGIALSPDGKTLASGGTATDPFNIYYWDILSEKRRPIPRGELSAVRGVAYSPDGRWLAAAGAVGVKVWLADTGVEVAHLAKSISPRPIAFSPNGRYLAAGGELGAIHVWRCENGQFIGVAEIKAESGAIYSLSFSPDGSLLASSSRDVKLWSIPSGAPHSTAVASRMTTSCVQFSPDGRRLLTAGDDRYVRVRDVESGAVLESYAHQFPVSAARFSSDGRLVASATHDGSVHLWRRNREVDTDADSNATLQHGGELHHAFWLDKRRCLTSGDGAARVWRADGERSSWREVAHWPSRHAAVSSDRRFIATLRDGTVEVRDAASLESRAALPVEAGLTHIALSNQGKWLAGWSSAGTERLLWNIETGKRAELPIINADSSGTTSLIFSPVDSTLAVGMPLWWSGIIDCNSNNALWRFAQDESSLVAISALAYSADGRLLATGMSTGRIRIWEIASRRNISTSAGHTQTVNWLAFSPDGRSLASASDDKTVRLWDVATGHEHATWSDIDSPVASVDFDPGGTTLIVGYTNGTVRSMVAEPTDAARALRSEFDSSDPNSANGLNMLAAQAYRTGDLARTIELAERAAERWSRLQDYYPGRSEYVAGYDNAQRWVVRSRLKLGALEEAARTLRSAIETARSRLGDRHVITARDLALLGECYCRQKRFDEALPLLDEAAAIQEACEPDTWVAHYTVFWQGVALVGRGERASGLEKLKAARAGFERRKHLYGDGAGRIADLFRAAEELAGKIDVETSP